MGFLPGWGFRGCPLPLSPAPVSPPPMTSTSTGSAAIDSSAATRVRNENGVASDNSRPSGGRGRVCAWYVLRGGVGRAAWRGRGEISGGAGSFKKKKAGGGE